MQVSLVMMMMMIMMMLLLLLLGYKEKQIATEIYFNFNLFFCIFM